MTELEKAESTLAQFELAMNEGHPWLPGAFFNENPGLDSHIMNALDEWVRIKRIAEQAAPAKRVSLSDDPNWRPSGTTPVLPGSKEWVEVHDDQNDDQHQA